MSNYKQFGGLVAEDSPVTSGDYGLPILAMRFAADTTTTSNDGDYTMLKVDEEGRLKVATKSASYTTITGLITTSAGAFTPTRAVLATAAVVADVSRCSNVVVSMTSVTSMTLHTTSFEGSIDSTDGYNGTWFQVQAVRSNIGTTEVGALTSTIAIPSYSWEASVNAYNWFRVASTSHTGTSVGYAIQRGTYATEPVPSANIQPIDRDLALTNVVAVNNDLFSIDTVGVKEISIQLAGTFAGTATFQGSGDGVTWYTINASNSSTGATVTTATAVGLFKVIVNTRFVRLRVTTFTSGTWAGVYRASSFTTGTPIGYTQAISGAISGSVTATLAASAVLAGDVALGVRATTTNTFAIGAAVTASGIRHLVSAATVNNTILRSAAGRLYGWHISNNTASWLYVKFHNIATAPTVGTGVVMTVGVPPNGRSDFESNMGYFFSAGIGCTTVTGPLDADNAVVTAGALVCDFIIG